MCRQAQIQTQINLILKPYKVKVKVKSLSRVQLFAILWTIGHQAPLSMGFPRQEYWSGLPFASPGGPPNPGIKPKSPELQADSLPSEPPEKPHLTVLQLKIHFFILIYENYLKSHIL